MSKSIFEKYKKDSSKVLEGVWRKIGDDENAISVKIAHAGRGNEKFQSFFITKWNDIKGSEDENDLAKKLNNEALVKFILKDWKNVKIRKGDGSLVSLPFTEKNAYKVLEECDELAVMILSEARDFSNFTSEDSGTFEQEVDLKAKKSLTPSNPIPSTK